MEKVDSPQDSETGRYALKEAPAKGVVTITYAGTVDFGLSDQKEEYTRGFRETRGMIRPEGVYLDGDRAWVPKFDDRFLQFAVEVQLPEGWHVISQGKGTSCVNANALAAWDWAGTPWNRSTWWVGPLHMHSDKAGGTDVAVYLHAQG